MAKFFVDPSKVEGEHIYIVDAGDIKHMTRVLRLNIGDEVSVSDGAKYEYETKIDGIFDEEVSLKIIDKHEFLKEPKTLVTLYQGFPKAAKFETIIQKNIEAGINRIVPVFMERTVVIEKGNFDKKLDRFRKIADEAVKQCKRGIIPEVSDKYTFNEMLSELKAGFDLVIVCYENEDGRTIKDALKTLRADEKGKKVAIVIGPEGGLDDKEIDELKVFSEIVTLGKTILRTETAGLVCLSMVMYELEL